MDLGSYRQSAETFTSELLGEYYRHYAGLKDDYEIEPIYARYQALFEREAVDALRERAEASPPDSEARRSATILLDFAVEGLIGLSTTELESELARREAGSVLDLDGEQLGFRESAVAQANEADAHRRATIDDARLAVIETELNPLYAELIERQHAISVELGYASYREMCARLKAVDLEALSAQTAAFTQATNAAYPELLEPELQRTLGFGLSDLRRSDLPRFFRAPAEDHHFPAQRLVESFVQTLAGLGIEIGEQPGVVLDVAHRPKKSPRAFCAPVRVPGQVYLVISPVGGRDDYDALFHEGGHTGHFASVDPELAFEYRYLGDNAITEGYAFLFQHLIVNQSWLRRRLGIDDATEVIARARAQKLIYLRRYAAKLAYELELHGAGGELDALAGRYSSLLSAALSIPWPRQPFLADVDAGFYCAAYLRAWVLETHVRRYLEQRFGDEWYAQTEAGDVLRGLWRQGQRLQAEELALELTGEELDFGALLDDLALSERG